MASNRFQNLGYSAFTTALSVGKKILTPISTPVIYLGKTLIIKPAQGLYFYCNGMQILETLSTKAKQSEGGIAYDWVSNKAVVVPISQDQIEFIIDRLGRQHPSFNKMAPKNLLGDTSYEAKFHRKELLPFLLPKLFLKHIEIEIENELEDKKEVKCNEFVTNIVYKVLAKVILGVNSLSQQQIELIKQVSKQVLAHLANPFPHTIGLFPKFRSCQIKYHEFAEKLIKDVVIQFQTNSNFNPNNLIIKTLLSLLKRVHPDKNDSELQALLKSIEFEKIKKYIKDDPYILSLPMIFLAGENLIAVLTEAIEGLFGYSESSKTNLFGTDFPNIEQLRLEIQRYQLFSKEEINFNTLMHMPYLAALFKEFLRSTGASLKLNITLPRYTNEAFDYKNVHIPADTMVFIDFNSILRDEKIWGGEDLFDLIVTNPENFMTSERKELGKFPFMPFSVRERKCPAGESGLVDYFFKIFVCYMTHHFDTARKMKDPITEDDWHIYLLERRNVSTKPTMRMKS